MDWEAYVDEAERACAAAQTSAELEAANIAYLGRRSPLRLALREVRDRETGMTLNAVRERLEAAFAEREAELRRDAIDATHYPIFHQFEGLAVDKGITLADLKGTLLHVMRALFGEDRRVRFRTQFFPFTEPSTEPDVSCGICDGAGCRTCRYSGWLEMGGAGMVDPRVFDNVGIDPDEWSGFAFGCGLARAAQLRYGIE